MSTKVGRSSMVHDAIATHVKEILTHLGLSTSSGDLKDTPMRVAKFLSEFRIVTNYEELLGATFEYGKSNLVTQSNIPFRMLCEHHLLPALGTAAIGYIPNKQVVGLSKLTRLVDAVGTEKPSIQEAITDRIADLLNKHLDPKGVIVVIRAEHSCMASRGVNVPNVHTGTSSVRGVFRDVPHARQEFFSLIQS